MSKYAGSRLAICRTGGSVTVAIALTTGQGNGGVSLPCKGCLVMARAGNGARIRMNIGAAATGDLGIELPKVRVLEVHFGFLLVMCPNFISMVQTTVMMLILHIL